MLFFLLSIPRLVVSAPQENRTEQNTQSEHYGQPQNWWETDFFTQVRATDFLVALFTGLLVWVGWTQARRISKSIRTQSNDMGLYISEAKRSADAMENVASSIAVSAQAAKESAAVTKEISERQQKYFPLQMRAYLWDLYTLVP